MACRAVGDGPVDAPGLGGGVHGVVAFEAVGSIANCSTYAVAAQGDVEAQRVVLGQRELEGVGPGRRRDRRGVALEAQAVGGDLRRRRAGVERVAGDGYRGDRGVVPRIDAARVDRQGRRGVVVVAPDAVDRGHVVGGAWVGVAAITGRDRSAVDIGRPDWEVRGVIDWVRPSLGMTRVA